VSLDLRFIVVIRCPKKGVEAPTGLTVDIGALHTLPQEKSPLLCPACGQEHRWSAADALLAHSTPGIDAPIDTKH
jgi:hypothetical protein